MARPRTKPLEQRREELMQAARTLFLQQGVDATSIEQVTLAAQVAKGSFYLYFSSKEELLSALSAQFAEQLRSRIEQALDAVPSRDWCGKLCAWAAAATVGYLEAKPLHDMLFYGARVSSRSGATDNLIVDQLCALLEGGRQARAWTLDDVRFSAVFLFSALHGSVDDVAMREARPQRARLIQRLQHLCLRVVGHDA